MYLFQLLHSLKNFACKFHSSQLIKKNLTDGNFPRRLYQNTLPINQKSFFFIVTLALIAEKNPVQKITLLKTQSFHDTRSKCPWRFFTYMTFNNLFSRESE